MSNSVYVDPATGEWVGESETRDSAGDIVARRTEWFSSEHAARQFSRQGAAADNA